MIPKCRILSDVNLRARMFRLWMMAEVERPPMIFQVLRATRQTTSEKPGLAALSVPAWATIHWAEHPVWMTDQCHHELMCIVLGTEGDKQYRKLDEATPKQAESG